MRGSDNRGSSVAAAFARASGAATGKPVNSEVLDSAHLARYSGGDAALEAELLGLFVLQMEQQFEALAGANDADGWIMATHTLKGCANTIGATEVAKAVMALEADGYQANDQARREQLSPLSRAMESCQLAIRQRIDQA